VEGNYRDLSLEAKRKESNYPVEMAIDHVEIQIGHTLYSDRSVTALVNLRGSSER
jgi:hypothetical protein